jgi:hypothetical protein
MGACVDQTVEGAGKPGEDLLRIHGQRGARVEAAGIGRALMSATVVVGFGNGLAGEGAGFRRRVRELESFHVGLWRSTEDGPPILGARVTPRRQRENAFEAERLLEDVARRCEAYPESEPARRRWRARVRQIVLAFGEDRLGWPPGYRGLLLSEAFYDTTVEFVRAARAFDSEVRIEDVTQALRNVWIMNSLQLLFDTRVGFSPAIFAFSMLYPCTDNYLDDPGVTPGAKVDFNRRLGRRLRGERLLPRTRHEQQAFALVGRIETQYPRARHPAVFRSLEAIHRAQEASLVQHRAADSLDEDRVLEISVAKGGSSLLADGYLVQGDLSPEEQRLCFGYGVFLQLLDDLQDIRADRAVGHTTLFTIAAREDGLGRLTSRLYRFMGRVLGGSPRIAGPPWAARRDLILRNCTALLVGAVALQQDLFEPGFRDGLEERWPLDLASMARLHEAAGRRLRGVRQALSGRATLFSPLDLL